MNSKEFPHYYHNSSINDKIIIISIMLSHPHPGGVTHRPLQLIDPRKDEAKEPPGERPADHVSRSGEPSHWPGGIG
ncbi:Hypothetical protein NTJ_15860 [Nesidiocoris tenuis]|uniref:Uncharacterized protein n=1 Tax=Nesidiocoris tenuis TaxID=355587 RepID=A0ABN7BFC1_9HEMI|nr:Hypothetical protein NTJ_15860 [Nesidiocoris tenuis]